MNELKVFDFNNLKVRTVIDGDSIYFIAKDVCDVLDISKYRDVIATLEDYERGCPVLVDTLGGKQEMSTINESGLYSLIMRSRKPEAKRFKKWVTSEVLPAIRRNGAYYYTGKDSTPANIEQSVSTMLSAISSSLIGMQTLLLASTTIQRHALSKNSKVSIEDVLNVIHRINEGDTRHFTLEELAKIMSLSADELRPVLMEMFGMQLIDIYKKRPFKNNTGITRYILSNY